MKRALQECIQYFCNYFSRKRPRLTYDEHTPNKMITSLSKIKYDVFISFRGSDTRRGFLSHLLNALSRANVEAYVDYKLKEGDELSSALSRAIEESQIALVLFSEDYASSKWCLEELVKITECMMNNGQIVVPIFYNLDPSDVRHQKGCYKNAFAKYEKLFKDNMMKVEKWRIALKEVASLSGFHSSNFGTEDELIKVVIQRVLARLSHMHRQFDLKGLVGIDKPISDLQSLVFCHGSNNVCVIGIWGMAGIGKTTIAGVLFNRLCFEYEGGYFLENSRQQSERKGMIQLRDKLISILLLEGKDLHIGTNVLPDHVLRRLRRKKILVVLDDVNDPDEVQDLVGERDWLGPGSRILVTTRDKHVISGADVIYKVQLLGWSEALQLVQLHAFNGRCLQENRQSLMQQVVEYAEGNPLALKVLSSFLRDKSDEEWRSQLHKLKKMPHAKIQNALRLSYEGLDRHDKSVFLYIACFFKGDGRKERVIMLLDACGYSTSIALKTLQDRCLINIDYSHSMSMHNLIRVSMHNLIREMGQEIVREQSIEKPGERSHLWDPDEICHWLKHDEGTEHIESITLDLSRVGDVTLSPHCFARMVNLKFLRFHYNKYPSAHPTQIGLHISEGFEIRSSNIRLFHWDCYLSKFFPITFNPENLVKFRMQFSCVTKLWDGVQNLPKLQVMDLWHSDQLVELPDLSKAPRLQYLDMSGCESLVSIHPSILSLPNLTYMDLQHSKKLVGLPDLFKTSSLKNIDMNHCDNLVSVHSSILLLPNVKKVNLSDCPRFEEFSGIEALPSSVTFPTKLRELWFQGCESLKHLPDSMSKLTSLQRLFLDGCKELDTSNLQIIFDGLHSLTYLSMDGCCKLYELPENINKLSSLSTLSLERTNVKSLPESIKHLSHLSWLNLNKCIRLQSIPELPPSLIQLSADDCTSLERVFSPTPQLLQQHISWAIENTYFYKTTFLFRNCPNLDKDVLDAFATYIKCYNEMKNEIGS